MANTHRAGRLLDVTETLAGTAAATSGNYGVFFTANQAMKILRVTARWEVASTSGTLQVRLKGSHTSFIPFKLLRSIIIAESYFAEMIKLDRH